MRTSSALLRLKPKRSIPKRQRSSRVAVRVGELVAIEDDGIFRVTFEGNPARSVRARTTVPLHKKQVGREVLLVFEDGKPGKPIITGVLHLPEDLKSQIHGLTFQTGDNPREGHLDGDRFIFSAAKELVFRCGKSSITLTQDGKVLIRGAYLLNSSSGVNRIRGGSVQIN